MRTALDGLAGIFSIEIDLSRDAFRISYDRSCVDASAMLGAIGRLGFRPRIVQSSFKKTSHRPPADELPPLFVAAMIARGRTEGRPLMVRFHAEWCLPCRTLEESVLTDADVRQALDAYLVLRVDADANPEAGAYYRINALPTLLILDDRGMERARFEGISATEHLAERLNAIAGEILNSEGGTGGEPAAPVFILPIVLTPTYPGG
ncbi:MAG: thioredoxin family protein [Acidobacteria bacterium]|nr:thioredoxin family protein [Acidobacteriota bacterium]